MLGFYRQWQCVGTDDLGKVLLKIAPDGIINRSMTQILKCQICEKAATVHLTQIVDNKIHKVHLCESCANEKGVTDPEGFSLENLFHQPDLFEIIGSGDEKGACQACGLTPRDYKTRGRLGCPSCYGNLKSFIEPMLREMHHGIQHCGKVPPRALHRVTRRLRYGELRGALDRAIEEERFEDAAGHRDEIRELEKD